LLFRRFADHCLHWGVFAWGVFTSALLARPTLTVRITPHNSALSVAVSLPQPNLEISA
jgi:hypothetical protein